MSHWSSLTDEELVDLFGSTTDQPKRESALSELMKRYQPLLMKRVYYQLRHRENSEEVLQEFWLDFSRKVNESYDPLQGRLKNWIYGVLQNKVRDFYRRQKRVNQNPIPLESVELWTTPAEKGEDLLLAIEKCLREFPRKYTRLLCVLMIPYEKSETEQWPEFSLSEEEDFPIGRLLNQRNLMDLADCLLRPLSELREMVLELSGETPPLSTVKTWKYRAFLLLQECLARKGFSPKAI